jgi:hypothetical protein
MLIMGARNNSASKVFTKKDVADLKHCFKVVLPQSGFTLYKGMGGWFDKGTLKEEHSRSLLFTTDNPKKVVRLLNMLIATFHQSSIIIVDLGSARFYSGRSIVRPMAKAKWRRELFDEVDI